MFASSAELLCEAASDVIDHRVDMQRVLSVVVVAVFTTSLLPAPQIALC